MAIIKKKICMLGASAVGKTSLVSRFVHSKFSEKYLTTVGVKIEQKQLEIDGDEVGLMLWDMQGEDRFQKVQMSYLRGTSGYFVVVDGTRRDTLDRALLLQKEAEAVAGDVPYFFIFNKSDLVDDWDVDDATIEDLATRSAGVVRTSAKTGDHVDETFRALAKRMLGGA